VRLSRPENHAPHTAAMKQQPTELRMSLWSSRKAGGTADRARPSAPSARLRSAAEEPGAA
jgi:hypothetical protein